MPAGITGNKAMLQFKTMPSVDELLNKLKIDPEYIQFALTDGQYIDIEQWGKPITAKRVQLWPRISGG
jgi:hypothetical protein